MSTDCIAVCQAFIRAINRHSIDDLRTLMSGDHVFVDPQDRSVSGRDTTLAAWVAYFGMFPDYTIEADTFIANRSTVAIFGHAYGTFRGKHGAVPEARITMPAAWKATVSKGKIKVWQVYADWSEGVKVIERETHN
jgi:ketosteroid isomerase-like protein